MIVIGEDRDFRNEGIFAEGSLNCDLTALGGDESIGIHKGCMRLGRCTKCGGTHDSNGAKF